MVCRRAHDTCHSLFKQARTGKDRFFKLWGYELFSGCVMFSGSLKVLKCRFQ
ncbi:hypothetical protein [Kingella negevensis]|uniref:hypothetical protein n=1 Tax=Kingella negevensis TaxID=1522312 RepID=UPI0012FD1A64|nr:hypothetical protein [Kingella negevensis]MDK4693393.1 hypothetical protein [Kingella negevensis]MDK4697291.1 hypothetical protein [Kingella negevensis]MDK4700005.1 hypothetical protein [Kingella negevensis]MDK4706810.1 hypothetical protein [Kingella negevensis]MDK4708884.1 hypothetical protein [Kingella negevensis]